MVKRRTTRRKTTSRKTTKRRTTKTKRKTTAKRKTTSWFKGKNKRQSTPYKAGSHAGVSWKKKSAGRKCTICSGPHSVASHRHHGPHSHRATRGRGTSKQYVAYQRKTTGYSSR